MAAKKCYGVVLAKANEESVNAALSAADLPEDGTLEEKIGRLVAYYRKEVSKENLAKCDNCEGVSDVSLDKCPYCGEGDEEEESEEEESEEEESEEEESEEEDEEEESEEEDEEEEEEEAPPPPPKKEKGKKAEPEPKPAKGKKAEPEPEPKPAKGKKAIDAVTTAIAPAKKPGRPPKAEIVKAEDGPDPKYKVGDLDTAIERVKGLRAKGEETLYDLGKELAAIHGEQLWKLRQDKDGNPAYKGFGQFCAAEVGLSHTTVFQLIDVSTKFDRKLFSEVGHKKLALVLQAPEAVQPELIKKVSTGVSHRDLLTEVKAKRDEAGVSKRNTGRKEMPKGKAPKSKKTEPAITIAAVIGKKTIKLYQDPKKSGKKELVPATDLAQNPFGYDELGNGVREYFSIQKGPDGALILHIVRKREGKEK